MKYLYSEVKFEFIGENTEVQNLLCSRRKEVTKIDKDGNESVVIIFYKIKLIDSARPMASS